MLNYPVEVLYYTVGDVVPVLFECLHWKGLVESSSIVFHIGLIFYVVGPCIITLFCFADFKIWIYYRLTAVAL